MSKPDPIDVHVGKRLKERRTILGKSQSNIGELLGLTFQQIQKYERGANRISSSRLFKLSIILDVPVEYFFEEVSDPLKRNVDSLIYKKIDLFEQDKLASRETLELVRNYYAIRNHKKQKRIFEFIKSLSLCS